MRQENVNRCQLGRHAERAARRVSASSTLTVSQENSNSVRGRSRIKYGMTPSFYNGGFTLIELLVVVLIIGILAAVALPKYQVAVNKARFATYRTLADSIAKAAQRYHLATGTWPDSFDVLDVNLPAGMTASTCRHGISGYTDKMYCCLQKPVRSDTYGQISCGDRENSLIYGYLFAGDNGTPWYISRCLAKSDTKAVCQSLGGKFVNKNGVYYQYFLPGSDTY